MHRIALILTLLVFVCGHTVRASEWESIGPYGGTILRVDRTDSTLWASTRSGVFRSDDSGRTWLRSGQIGQFMSTSCVINAFGAYYNAGSTGIWRSADGWQWTSALDSGVTLTSVRDIELHRGRLLASTWIGTIMESADSGATWRSVEPDSAGAFVHDLFSIDTVLLIATPQGAYRSVNGGRTNRMLFPGSCYGFTLEHGVVIAWSNPARRSADSGRTWSTLPIPEARTASRSSRGTWIIGSSYRNGAWRSVDDGVTWSKLSTSELGSTFGASQSLGDDLILCPTEVGCYRSDDQGETWTRSTDGISAADVQAVSSAHGTLYVGCDGLGLFSAQNPGSSWSTTFKGHRVNVLAARDKRVITGYGVPGSVTLSTDSGKRYETIRRLTEQSEFIEGVFLDNSDIYVADNRRLIRSTDNGGSWVEASNGLPDAIVYCMTFNASAIYCGTITAQHGRDGGVFRSTDRGESWKQCALATFTTDNVFSLTSIDTIIIAGTSRGVHRSDDNGATWSRVALFAPVSLIQHRGVIFGATTFGLIYSRDKGLTWTFVEPYLPDALVQSVAALDDHVYLGVDDGGVLKRLIDFVELEVTVADQTVSEAPFHVIPNPVERGSITLIGGDLQGATISILDLSGHVLIQQQSLSTPVVDVASLPPGMYICALALANGDRQTTTFLVHGM